MNFRLNLIRFSHGVANCESICDAGCRPSASTMPTKELELLFTIRVQVLGHRGQIHGVLSQCHVSIIAQHVAKSAYPSKSLTNEEPTFIPNIQHYVETFKTATTTHVAYLTQASQFMVYSGVKWYIDSLNNTEL